MSGQNVWEIFSNETPGVAEARIKLSNAININGVLDDKTICLIKIGVYSTIRDPIALRHFVNQALNAGASKKEIQAAALMGWGTGVTVAELSIPLIKEIIDNT